LSTLMGMSMFGVLFALPRFYQAVQGNSTLGTGATIALGFVVTAARLAAGAFTTALGALDPSRAGSGSALIQALRQGSTGRHRARRGPHPLVDERQSVYARR